MSSQSSLTYERAEELAEELIREANQIESRAHADYASTVAQAMSRRAHHLTRAKQKRQYAENLRRGF